MSSLLPATYLVYSNNSRMFVFKCTYICVPGIYLFFFFCNIGIFPSLVSWPGFFSHVLGGGARTRGAACTHGFQVWTPTEVHCACSGISKSRYPASNMGDTCPPRQSLPGQRKPHTLIFLRCLLCCWLVCVTLSFQASSFYCTLQPTTTVRQQSPA